MNNAKTRWNIQEILKYTPKEHAEYQDLSSVNDRLGEIVNSVNERTRQVERVQQLLELKELFEGVEDYEEEYGFKFLNEKRHYIQRMNVKQIVHQKNLVAQSTKTQGGYCLFLFK